MAHARPSELALGAILLALGLVALARSGGGIPPEPARAQAPAQRADPGTMAYAAAPEPPSPDALRALRGGGRLDLNTATAADLRLLPGIGPALSARIVADRSRRGPFDTLRALARVPGIGPKTLLRLQPLLSAKPSNFKDQ